MNKKIFFSSLVLSSLFCILAEAEEKQEGKKLSHAYAGKTVKNSRIGHALIKARAENVPKVGEEAPDFILKTVDGEKEVKLSSFEGNKPVVLIFGSIT